MKFFGADQLVLSSNLTLVASVLVILTSILGCCMVNDDKPRWILLYSFLVLVCISLQAVSSVVVYERSQAIGLQMVRNGIVGRFSSQSYEVKNKIQKVQNDNFCCGVDGKRF